MNSRFVTVLICLLCAACSAQEEKLKMSNFDLPESGSCYYKVVFTNNSTDGSTLASQFFESVGHQISRDKINFLSGIQLGTNFNGRVFLELVEPCEDYSDDLNELVADTYSELSVVGQSEYEGIDYLKSNWFEMNAGIPDIKNDYNADKSYYDAVEGSCFYRVDVVQDTTGFPVQYSEFGNDPNNPLINSKKILEIRPDSLIDGRIHLKLAKPCVDSYSYLKKAISELNGYSAASVDTKLSVVQFTQSTENIYNSRR